MNQPEKILALDHQEVKRFLPHRYPFLLVDRVLEIQPVGDLNDTTSAGKAGIKVVAIKNITGNEEYFQGHFPDYPVVPGVLLIEMMAQTACFSLYPYFISRIEYFRSNYKTILVGADGVRFRKQVLPGDTLRIESEVTKTRGSLWFFKCAAYVGTDKVVEGDLIANLATDNKVSGAKQ